MTTAPPHITLLHLSLSLSCLQTTRYCLSLCCHTPRRCCSIVRTLCLRREKWGHYPPAVLTSKSYILWYLSYCCTWYEIYNFQFVIIRFFTLLFYVTLLRLVVVLCCTCRAVVFDCPLFYVALYSIGRQSSRRHMIPRPPPQAD